jgi:NADH dehydrogenase/NADH:ubiquinone oxidoreductase subunit G
MQEDTFVLNGQSVSFSPGQTILEAAADHGVRIPTLRHLKGVTPTGSCRICVVEVAGARNLPPACATPVTPAMQVQTDSPRVEAARRQILELLLALGNHSCVAGLSEGVSWTELQLRAMAEEQTGELCPAWGDCRLQDLAIEYQVQPLRFAPRQDRAAIEAINPLIVRDFSRCILCGRCVQACHEVQVNNAISFGYRGAGTKIVAAGDRPLKDSQCVFCGECVQVCPTGALIEKKARYQWRPWKQERRVRSTCP